MEEFVKDKGVKNGTRIGYHFCQRRSMEKDTEIAEEMARPLTKTRAQLCTGMTGALRSTEGPLHGADDIRQFSHKYAPIMTGETAFPLRCSDSYPFASCSRDRPQAIWELWLKATKPGLKILFSDIHHGSC